MAKKKEANLDSIRALLSECDPDNLEALTGGELETLGLIGVLNKERKESTSRIEQLEQEVTNWQNLAMKHAEGENRAKDALAKIKPRYETLAGQFIDKTFGL